MTDDARERKIRDLLPLVRKIARRVHRMVAGSEFEDLTSEGAIGLIRAVDTFDPKRGPSLEQYAARVIAGAMLNGIRRLDPVSERVRREIREAERERYALATASGSLPTHHEMEKRRPALRRARLHAYCYTPLSLDAALPFGEKLSGDWSGDPAQLASRRGDREGVRAAIGKLPPRQRDVLTLHYYRGRSLHQIGREMAISPQRASQLHLAALRNLRKVMHVSAAS